MSLSNTEILLQPIHTFLGCKTPSVWLEVASQSENLALIIQDHANCEIKAANTAIKLMFRYGCYADLQIKLAQLVREEMLHYEQVLEIMLKRGQVWQTLPAGRYAGALRKKMNPHEPEALVDVLIVGAFVEARSCERFAALIPYVDDELARFYKYLLKSESRHFEDYLSLAQTISEHDITPRIEIFRQLEAELITTPDEQLRFHSGIPV